jgi:hypothetical protein
MLPSIAIILFSVAACGATENFGYHNVQLDEKGRIVSWAGPPAVAYDKVVRLTWHFWHEMKPCPNGVSYYLQHQVWKPEEDPRGIGGDQIPMALSSWNLLYGYLGDESIKENMVHMADYWLDHGRAPATAYWANLPYPYNTDLHSGVYDGDMRAGKGGVQPDKAASFAAELIMLYKMTGNRRYLDAAEQIADTLAAHITPGDAENSPWPYRVHAISNQVHTQTKDGRTFTASYTSNYTGALRMFEGLPALGRGDAKKYAAASAILVNWLKKYPLRTNKWGPFFEDIPTADWSDTEHNADTLAMYILERRKNWDENWREHAKSTLDWSYRTFANHEFDKWGVVAINEQTAYRVPGNSHTSRHAAVEFLYCEQTDDCSTKEDAIRRLNWATYTVDNDGKNRYPRDDVWLTDGYGDYVRHYLRAMASAPELAPNDQNHLLRTSTVIQSIRYEPGKIRYTKFDANSVERFKFGAFTPISVVGGEMSWDAKTRTAQIRSGRKQVVITGK